MTISLYVYQGQWFAQFPQASDEARIMGTTYIPTPFFASHFTGLEVQAEIQRLNPGANVVVVPPLPARALPRLQAAVAKLRTPQHSMDDVNEVQP
jgi:hypothetical protein